MPLVLSNDDGVAADGLATLHRVLAPRTECLIVAPAGPQSGVGHAVTTGEPLRLSPSLSVFLPFSVPFPSFCSSLSRF